MTDTLLEPSANDTIEKEKIAPPLAPKDLMAFVLDSASWEVVEDLGIDVAIYDEGIAAALKRLAGEGTVPANVIVVDMSEAKNPVEEAATLVYLCGGETKIIGVGAENDVGLYRDLLNAGFTDYLSKPLNVDSLAIALDTPTDGKSARRGHQKCKTYAVIGTRGGCGASTIITNLAWLFADKYAQKTALVDLDPHFGTLALGLDVDPSHGFVEAVKNPGRIDDLFVNSSLVNVRENLAIISMEEDLETVIEVSPVSLMPLLFELEKSFSAIFLDVPRSAIEVQGALAKKVDEILLVTDLSLAGVRDTIRLKTIMEKENPSCKIQLIANRASAGGGAEIPAKEFEKAVDHKILFTVLEDAATFHASANSGRPVVEAAPLTKAAKELFELCGKLTGDEVKRDHPILAWLKS